MKINLSNKSLLIFALIGIGFFVYAFNLNNPLFWDDDDWIINNLFVHDLSHIKEIFSGNVLTGFGLSSNYYRPLLLLTFAFNYIIDGIKPLGYHLFSNGLHITNGVLIFLILTRFIGGPAAFLASLLFLIHPLQTEAVTYISGRGDPLSVLFMLLAMWVFSTSQVQQNSRHRKSAGLIAALLLMFLALLSRETAIILPFLLILFYVAFLSENKFISSIKSSFLKTWPYFVGSAVYFILRLTSLNFNNTLNFYSQANAYSENLLYRLNTFGAVLIEYFKLIFVPVGLHMERDLVLRTSIFQWPVWLAVGIILGILYYGVQLYKKENKLIRDSGSVIQDSEFKIWFFGWGLFFIGLGPVSGIIPINAVMYEHWLYLPLIGLFILTGFYLDKLWSLITGKKILQWLLVVTIAAYISFFGYQSIQRNILWGDPIKFYEDILRYNPSSLRVTNNLANLYSGKGDIAKAEELYLKATQGPNGQLFAQPYYNLADIYRDRGDTNKAIIYYKKAIEADPSFPFSYQNLGVIYANRNQLVEAAEMLEIVKKLKPYDPRVYYNLALIYIARNNTDAAIENLEMGLPYARGDKEAEDLMKSLLQKVKR